MSRYLRLNEKPNSEGKIQILANFNTKQYVNLGGYNETDVIKSVHAFFCENDIWRATDKVVIAIRNADYVPPVNAFSNISHDLIFYKKGVIAREAREREIKKAEHNPFVEDSEVLETKAEPIITALTNPEDSDEDPELASLIDDMDSDDESPILKPKPVTRGKPVRGRGRGRA